MPSNTPPTAAIDQFVPSVAGAGEQSGRRLDVQAAEAVKRTASRARRRMSCLLRAREIAGFTFHDCRIDVRGWQVMSGDSKIVGRVDSLFVDARARSVRYLGIARAGATTTSTTGRVLVPVGLASRAQDRDVVLLDALTAAQLATAPRLPDRPVTRGDEAAALAALGIDESAAASAGDNLYRGPSFDESHLIDGLALVR